MRALHSRRLYFKLLMILLKSEMEHKKLIFQVIYFTELPLRHARLAFLNDTTIQGNRISKEGFNTVIRIIHMIVYPTSLKYLILYWIRQHSFNQYLIGTSTLLETSKISLTSSSIAFTGKFRKYLETLQDVLIICANIPPLHLKVDSGSKATHLKCNLHSAIKLDA